MINPNSCDYCHGVGACPECWGRAGIDELKAELLELARKIDNTARYVRATVSTGNSVKVPHKPDWQGCHRGRCASSERQLSHLIEKAREIKMRFERDEEST